MEGLANGLSLVLGRVLTAWAEQLTPAGIDRYLEIGGFQGLVRAAKGSALEVIGELRASGLRDLGPGGEPVYRSWQQFQRRSEPGILVVDALELDPRSQSTEYLMRRNPFGLLEGLLAAAHACDADKAVVLIPEGMAECEASLLNALEMVGFLDLHLEHPIEVELVRGPGLSLGDHSGNWTGEGQALVHNIATWYQIALVMSLGGRNFSSLGLKDHSGACLVTLGGEINNPGLVETPLGGELWQMVETLGGGFKDDEEKQFLSLDAGLGGFLSPDAAHTALAHEELSAAGVAPLPGTVWVEPEGACLVERTRKALYRYWLMTAEDQRVQREPIARALRMVTEIARGKGRPEHISELQALAASMAAQGLKAAWPLASSLKYFPGQWRDHVINKSCVQGICIERRPAPCHSTCPANIDIPSFLAMIGHEQYKKAIGSISKDNPLPLSCGLVCPAPCEDACLRAEMDQAIQIRAMKAVAAERSLEKGGYPKPRIAKPTGKKVAVVGSGPGGVTCAYYLALKGHAVTVFEAQEEAGGMLRYGIPAYRLPRESLNDELAQITRLGIDIQTGHEIKNVAELRALGFDAIFLGLGIQLSRFIPIEGVDQPFVLGGLDFLKGVRRSENPRVGPRVIVVGGGNVAIDVALSALRQGAKRVDMLCLEKRREMPASQHELATAIEEGVAIHNAWGPVKVSEDASMTFQQCTRVFDERGRFSPLFNPQRTLTIEADQILLAIGQATDLACVEVGSDIEVQRGFICTDDKDLSTREAGVFAGGDVVHGPQTAVMAIRAGKRAAAAMDAYLKGRKFDPAKLGPIKRAEVEPTPVSAVRRNQLRRAKMPSIEVEDRLGNYQQIDLGLTDQMAHDEASRCLRCDLCIGCGLCQLVCSEMGAEALRLGETAADRLAFKDFTRPSTRCVGCGACAQACPTGAITVEDINGFRRTVITGTVVKEQKLITCGQCGESYVSQAYLDHLKKRVGPAAVEHVDQKVCPVCARKTRALELAGAPFFGMG